MKYYLLNPFSGKEYMNDVVFDGPLGVLRAFLEERGIEIYTYDKGNLAKAEKVLTLNHNPYFYLRCKYFGVPRDRLVLFMFDPAAVIPEQHTERVWKKYGTIFTVRDDLIDNKRFFKLRFPQKQKFSKKTVSFKDRRFLTLMNANKYSYEPNNLYGLRRSAIRFFDSFSGFDFYGHGWNDKKKVLSLDTLRKAIRSRKVGAWMKDIVDAQRQFISNKGGVNDKYYILGQYKFCICFENESSVPGYITEKIFDCFLAGVVPIYFGAPNITHYVPKDSFIDYSKFNDFKKLADFLSSMAESEWLIYYNVGQKYLDSEQYKQWQPEAIFAPIVSKIVKEG